MKISCRILPLLTIVLIMTTVSCQTKFKVPDQYISPEALVPLLIDIHLADGLLQQQRATRQIKEDSAFNYYAAILKEHRVSRVMFDSTIHFYAQYPEEFAKIYDEVMKELSIKEGDLRKEAESKDTEKEE